MKTRPKNLKLGVKPKGEKSRSKRGVALVTVLTIMSLATILIMTFFTLAQNEHNASTSYSDGLQAQQVAEQAVNMVIRQIRRGTVGRNPESAAVYAWASQPGAIRVWNSKGEFDAGYKLYSDDQMVATTESELVDGDFAEFSSWSQRPWQYVDLNEPVIRGEKVYYPIVDPIAKTEPKWPAPLGSDQDGIEGFDFDLSGVEPGPMDEAVKKAGKNVLPMPAMWIYQLKDGTLGYIDSSKRFQAFQSTASQPTQENPIVARFAFWTDDETCKLNPNVHAGGASWATPMAGGDIDRNLGRFQPAQHEWQRYPGHAATTHLAPVLAPGITDITYQRDNMEMIFDLVPRVVGGGSESGTRKVNPNNPAERNGLIPDKDRLYASMDEFIMRPDRTPNQFPEPGTRGRAQETRYMQDHIERSKFFLSVVSRAPEVTVFNTPRVSIWPTFYDEDSDFVPAKHTPFDRLIRFCAEIGSPSGGDDRYEYHFQRANEDSTTHDYENIPRNQELLAYLEKLTATEVPGTGASFNDKYPRNERLQLLTEVFDYIRSTNLHDDTVFGFNWKDAFTKVNSEEHLTFTNGRRIDRNDRLMHKGHGQVTPIRINYGGLETKGLGRFYTIIEAGVNIICCADGGTPGMPGGGWQWGNPGVHQYRNGQIEGPSGEQYSNFPPLHPEVVQHPAGPHNPFQPGVSPIHPSWVGGFEWLKDVGDAGGQAMLDKAFARENWNWQLAWLDENYESQMPTQKYNQNALSRTRDTRLEPGEKCLQASMVFNGFTPSLGWVPINPDMQIDIQLEGMTFPDKEGDQVKFGWTLNLDQALSTTGPGPNAWATSQIARLGEGKAWTGGDRTYGGIKPAPFFLRTSGNNDRTELDQQGRLTPLDRGWEGAKNWQRYPWVTKPWKISGNKVSMTDGVVRMNIYSAGNDGRTEGTASQEANPNLVQELEFDFPPLEEVEAPDLTHGHRGYINEFGRVGHWRWQPMHMWSLSYDGANPELNIIPGTVKNPNDRNNPRPAPWLDSMDSDGSRTGRLGRVWHLNNFVRAQDCLHSVGVRHADFRLVATRPVIKKEDKLFVPHYNYGEQRMAHNFSSTPGDRAPGAGTDSKYNLVPDQFLKRNRGRGYHPRRRPYAMHSDTAADAQRYGDFDNGMGNSIDGSYLNKPDEGNLHSLFKRSDPTAYGIGQWDLRRDYGDFPYFVRDYFHEAGTPSYFSPNRIISSPGMFGSLPVGTTLPWDDQIGQPWRTLLFRPNVTGTGSEGLYDPHPGAENPPDHYFLDLFWMPVVEPYAISEPLSTGGKVNLNYQILPYTNIKRSAALRGVFKSEYMLCIPNRWAWDYKIGVGRGHGYHWRDNPYGGKLQSVSLRTIILEDETLAQFEERFDEKDIFRTASEICEIHLIPQDLAKRRRVGGAAASMGTYTPSKEDMESGKYWADHALVGDNGRERPYSNIYTRLTTKSNTYKVHFRAQVVKQASLPDRDFTTWNELTDTMVAEYRGSTIVERYVEPNDPDIPDYAVEVVSASGDDIATNTIDEYYKFRIVNPTRFAP